MNEFLTQLATVMVPVLGAGAMGAITWAASKAAGLLEARRVDAYYVGGMARLGDAAHDAVRTVGVRMQPTWSRVVADGRIDSDEWLELVREGTRLTLLYLSTDGRKVLERVLDPDQVEERARARFEAALKTDVESSRTEGSR